MAIVESLNTNDDNKGSFSCSYLSIDTRALALFRIALGLCCIFDVIRRIPYLNLFYTNKGVLSNHFALFSEPYRVFSLLYSLSNDWEVLVFFGITLIAALCLTVGYKTKVSLIMTLVGMVSIINRNFLLIYGGDTVLINCLFFSLFFPLSEQMSVDSRRHPVAPRSFSSIATILFFLQLSGIYLFASIHKTGESWASGLGLYYSLNHSRLTSTFGYWVGQVLPISGLKLLSDAALWIEFLGALLILCPLRSHVTRICTFLMLATFHISSALFFNIGLFPFAMLTHLIPLIPSNSLNRIIPYKTSNGSSPIPTKIQHVYIREFFALIFGVFVILSFISSNWIIDNKLRDKVPHWVHAIANYTSFRESWSMFGPEAPHTDYYLSYEATLDNGQIIDVTTGLPPNSGVIRPGQRYWDQHLDALTGLLLPDRGIHTVEVTRWIMDRRGGMHIPPERKIKKFEIKKYSWRTPLPGESAQTIHMHTENLLRIDAIQ